MLTNERERAYIFVAPYIGAWIEILTLVFTSE